MGPTTRPPSKPSRNEPSSDRSANRYAGLTRRSITPMASGGVINRRSFTFWSESRISVKRTLRKAVHRTSIAAKEAATPTFRSKVNRRSFPEERVSIGCDTFTVAKGAADVKRRARIAAAILRRWPCDGTHHEEEKKDAEKGSGGGEDCRASGSAHAFRPVHDPRIGRARQGGDGGGAGSRAAEWKGRSGGAHSFAMPHRRRSGVTEMRLPGAARAFPARDCEGALRNAALFAARGPGHRFDEQAESLRIAGPRHGYGGGQRAAGLCGRL